ncbi:MAG TPA: hypothetical protein VMT30_00065 [Candidatus Saccharimonadia bacterium]|nr:hypothetical protein [Candidatus Saccharimonadia bacterium]
MALARWQATIVDEDGTILPGASVEVRQETGGSPLAVLFSDRSGLVSIGNPFVADAEGFAAFHVIGGAYKITATSGTFSRTWRYVGIGTASEHDDDSDDPLSGIALDAGASINWNLGDVTITHVLSGSPFESSLAFTGAEGGYSFDDDILQPSKGTHGLWTDVSPFVSIAKLDRVFVGSADSCTGSFNANDQGGIVPTVASGASYLAVHAQLLSYARNGGYGIVGGSRSSDQFGTSGSIGVSGFLINDKASGIGWALYSDLQHESGALSSYGLEVAAKNKGSNVNPDPYNMGGAGVIGVWLAGGGDNAYGGNAANPSANAIGILKNAHTWNKGIVFRSDALTGTDGVTGVGEAISLARGHQINWYYAGSNFGAGIQSIVDASSSSLLQTFDDKTVYWVSATSKLAFQISYNASAVNYLTVTSTTTGNGPIIGVAGDDTNISLNLTGKGSGTILADRQITATLSSTFAIPLQAVSTDASASAGPFINLFRNSASPAANDLIGSFLWQARNSTPATINAIQLAGTLLDPTAGSEDTQLDLTLFVAGATSAAMSWANGVTIGAPTGGFQGAGTLNMDNAIYRDGTQVVATRVTGWNAPGAGATRGTFNVAGATAATCAGAIAGLIEDLRSHGLIGT